MEVKKAAGALGAWVSNLKLQDVVDSHTAYAWLRAALVEHQVVFLADQQCSPKVFEAFACRFGPVQGHPAYATVPGTQGVQILESTAENPSKIEVWHSDMTYSAAPPAFTILHGQIIPPWGGDTLFASAVAAWQALSAPMQQLLAGLTAVHDFRHGFQESLAEPGGAERLSGAVRDNPPVTHPLVRRHPETGALALYVNALFTTRIKELERHESDDLLAFLCEHIVTEEFTVRLRWKAGTVAIWDNRSTQHKPVNDFFPEHRLMHRMTIAGDPPV